MKNTKTKKTMTNETEKAKKPKKVVATKQVRVKNTEEDLIETYDVDDFDLDLSYYRDIAGSMSDW